jgi:hypothetical protein
MLQNSLYFSLRSLLILRELCGYFFSYNSPKGLIYNY